GLTPQSEAALNRYLGHPARSLLIEAGELPTGSLQPFPKLRWLEDLDAAAELDQVGVGVLEPFERQRQLDAPVARGDAAGIERWAHAPIDRASQCVDVGAPDPEGDVDSRSSRLEFLPCLIPEANEVEVGRAAERLVRDSDRG